MSAFAGVNDKNAPRAFSWIWFIRIVQIVFAFIVLGLAARDSHDLLDAQCQVTSKIAFNLACVRYRRNGSYFF